MVGHCSLKLDDGPEMKDFFEFLVPLEESELFYHVSRNCVEIDEFHVFGGGSPSRFEQPFVLGLNKGAMLRLIHRW